MPALNYPEKSVAEQIAQRLKRHTGKEHEVVKAGIGWSVKHELVPPALTDTPAPVQASPEAPVVKDHSKLELVFILVSEHPKSLVIQHPTTGKPRWVGKADLDQIVIQPAEKNRVVVIVDAALAKKRGWLDYAVVS